VDLVPPIRILSDLHVGHPACPFEAPEQLAPIFRGAGTVIFNGDTAELLSLRHRDRGQRLLEELAQVCLAEGANPVFITGNHDPVVSSAHHWDLSDGALLVTHGDILFHDVAPWSREAQIIGPAHTRVLHEMGWEALMDLERSLVAAKRATLALEMHECTFPRGPLARAGMVVRECWPPWRLLRIFRLWSEAPSRAACLGRAYRPRARFIVFGHTHRAGVWERGERVVINTGSFLPLAQCKAVELGDGRLSVHPVARRGGRIAMRRAERVFRVSPLPEAPGRSSLTEPSDRPGARVEDRSPPSEQTQRCAMS
jgi:predicted phosphodiesterase